LFSSLPFLVQPVDEVADVAPAALGLARFQGFEQPALVADGAHHVVEHLAGRFLRRAGFHALDEVAELAQRGALLDVEFRVQARRVNRGEQALVAAAGGAAERFEGGAADAALGRGHGADEGRVVVLVGKQPQVGGDVLDLGAVEEGLAAGDDVGNLLRAQLLLEGARLVVAAIEDGVVGKLGAPLEAVRGEAGDHPLGFVLAVAAGCTWIASPWPCSDQSCLSKSLGLLAISALAAVRMRAVER
jgi:hypothetical protein